MPTIKKEDDLKALWGAGAIARTLGLDVRQVYRLLELGALPATKIGGRWVSTRSRLARAIAGEETLETRKG